VPRVGRTNAYRDLFYHKSRERGYKSNEIIKGEKSSEEKRGFFLSPFYSPQRGERPYRQGLKVERRNTPGTDTFGCMQAEAGATPRNFFHKLLVLTGAPVGRYQRRGNKKRGEKEGGNFKGNHSLSEVETVLTKEFTDQCASNRYFGNGRKGGRKNLSWKGGELAKKKTRSTINVKETGSALPLKGRETPRNLERDQI